MLSSALPGVILARYLCLSAVLADEGRALYQSTPHMAREYRAEAIAGSLELASDASTKPGVNPALKIVAHDAEGWVRGASFTLEKTSESEFGAVFLDARFYVKASPDFRGQYDVRLFVPDAREPEHSFSVPLRHFKAHAEDGAVANGFRLTHKALCAVNILHPNLRFHPKFHPGKNMARAEGCEVRVYFKKASGTFWLADVVLHRARPQWSQESWDKFEQPESDPIVLAQGNLFQPMYERFPDQVSAAGMDTVHKLLRVAGGNAVSEWVGWDDDFGRTSNWLESSKNRVSDYIHRIRARNRPTPGGGDADYGPSLEQLATYIDNAHYYGLQVGIMLQGTPDWTHPGRYNNRSPHSDFENPLRNPGSATNDLPDPYPGPQTFTFQDGQRIKAFNHCQYPPDHWSDWEDLAKALVTRLKGKVLYYEIFNELQVDHQASIVGGHEVALHYLRRFYDVAKAIDPRAAVVSPDCAQMMPAMIAHGLADCCDWYGFHSYSTDYQQVRRIAEAGGVRKHLMVTEGPGLHEAWFGKLRGEGVWTPCSLRPDDPVKPDLHYIVLKNAEGKRMLNADPNSSGDRVDWRDALYDWGYITGRLERGNLDGASKPGRIRITVPAKVTVADSATVVLTAANTSTKTYTDVRLWPIGFVDALGFDKESLRTNDRTIAELRPGQTETIRMRVVPRRDGPFPARGTFRIGLAVVNREGDHSIASGQLNVTELTQGKVAP